MFTLKISKINAAHLLSLTEVLGQSGSASISEDKSGSPHCFYIIEIHRIKATPPRMP